MFMLLVLLGRHGLQRDRVYWRGKQERGEGAQLPWSGVAVCHARQVLLVRIT